MEKNPKVKPPPDFANLIFVDDIEAISVDTNNALVSQMPYIMDYSETNSDFGDRRNNREDTRRSNKGDSLLKGYHSSEDTYIGNIWKLVWA